jgi:hypothetical protein
VRIAASCNWTPRSRFRGFVDRKGKLRAGWLQRLEGLVSVAKGLDAMLGLERRQKRVPGLSEVMAE